MKHFFTLLFCIFILNAKSQIIYTENDGPKAGQQTEFKKLENIYAFNLNQLGLPGSNLTWDIRGKAEDFNTTAYVSISNLPFKNQFPGANLAQVEVPNTDSSYTVLEKNSTGLYWLGIKDSANIVLFNSKYKVMPYPLVFGTNFQNDIDANFIFNGLPFKFEAKSNSTVDSWGIITTNEGSYPVIKVLSKQIIDLTTTGIPISNATIETHSWLASGFSNPVAELKYEEAETPFGITNDTTLVYIHRQEVATVNAKRDHAVKLILTPNPVSDWLSIGVGEEKYLSGEYEIISSEGKKVLFGKISNGETIKINVQSLSPGNYLVQLLLDKKQMVFDILIKK